MKVSEVLFYMNYSFSIRGDVDYSTDLSIKNLDIQLYDEPGKETAVLTDEAFHAAAIDAEISINERRIALEKKQTLMMSLPPYTDFMPIALRQLELLIAHTGCEKSVEYQSMLADINAAYNEYNS